MIGLSRHQILLAMLVAGILGTPVTYRGGASAPHPHMFLQLWHDAAEGSFSHRAHDDDRSSNHAHHHAETDGHAPPVSPVVDDAPHPTVSAFVVSDWGVPALLVPSVQPVEQERPHADRALASVTVPAGFVVAPVPPPPRTVSI